MMTPQDVLQAGTQRTIAPRTHPYSPYVQETWSQEYGMLGGPVVGTQGRGSFPGMGTRQLNTQQAVDIFFGQLLLF